MTPIDQVQAEKKDKKKKEKKNDETTEMTLALCIDESIENVPIESLLNQYQTSAPPGGSEPSDSLARIRPNNNKGPRKWLPSRVWARKCKGPSGGQPWRKGKGKGKGKPKGKKK